MSVINPSKPILIFLAAGVQGSAVVRAARLRGLKVRALVRDRNRSPRLNFPGIEMVEGDLSDVASLHAACIGVDHAVLHIPIDSIALMKTQAENALTAFSAAGIRSFILKLTSASRPAPCAEPSFVANLMIEDAALRSGIPFAIVRPTLYLDNLLKPSARAEIIEQGVFAPPIRADQRIAWTSADDCAEAALMLLARGAMGGDHRIAGPESLTGNELAAQISVGLGRPVIYHSQSLDQFEHEVNAALGSNIGRRIISKFCYFAAYPDDANTILAAPFLPQAGLESFMPTSVTSWVQAHLADFIENDAVDMLRNS